MAVEESLEFRVHGVRHKVVFRGHGWGEVPASSQKCEAVPRRARISGS